MSQTETPTLASAAAITAPDSSKWNAKIAQVERAIMNLNYTTMRHHLKGAADIDLARTVEKAMEILERPTLSETLSWNVAAFILDRVLAYHVIAPDNARIAFLAINRYAGSGNLRKRIREVGPQIGMGPGA